MQNFSLLPPFGGHCKTAHRQVMTLSMQANYDIKSKVAASRLTIHRASSVFFAVFPTKDSTS
jgi:hypothetical protein